MMEAPPGQPQPTFPHQAHLALCPPGHGSPGSTPAAQLACWQLWATSGPSPKEGPANLTDSSRTGKAPASDRGQEQRGRSPSPHSATPHLSSSSRGYELLAAQFHGGRAGTSQQTSTHSGKPPLLQAQGAEGHRAAAWARTDPQVCPEHPGRVCAWSRQGAGVVQCTSGTCLPVLHHLSGLADLVGGAEGLGWAPDSSPRRGPRPPFKSDTQAGALPEGGLSFVPSPKTKTGGS